MKINFALFIFFILTLSCTNHGEKKKEVKKVNGNIVMIDSQLVDTSFSNKEIGYYDDSLSIEFINAFSETKNNRESNEKGLHHSYYRNGEVEKIFSFKGDDILGKYTKFDKNGRLKYHSSVDYNGDVFMAIKWDTLGNVVDIDGLALSPVIATPKLEYSMQDTIEIFSILTCPPVDFYSKIYIKINQSEYRQMKPLDNYLGEAYYKFIPEEKGEIDIYTMGVLYDSIKGEVLRDTFKTYVNVR
ncbi:MAG: hypothetical protein ACQERC_07955 [Bacteroidota bacterium]